MTHPIYSEVVDGLVKAGVPVRELGNDGRVAITLAAGRVVAMAFSPGGPNLLWSSPQLGDTELVRNSPEKLIGGFGGDRLWFAPELAFHWHGRPDWQTFANYHTPHAMDPGAYEFVEQDSRSVTLHAAGQLPVVGIDRCVGFDVHRTIRLADSPLAPSHRLMHDVDYVGIEFSHVLKLDERTRVGAIDLWHLLQVPTGSILIVPLRSTTDARAAEPLSYGLPGGWVRKSDHILWRYGGEASAKFGLSATASTGRSAVLRELGPDRWCLIVRRFAVHPQGSYVDHPYGAPRADQVFQAWDGFGFGEMEFHSTSLDAQHGPREIQESDQLWAFGGTAKAIDALARHLLDVDVSYIFGPDK